MLTAGGDSPREMLIWTIFGNTLDFFFILSGFVLFLPVLRRRGEVGRFSDFYIKRFSRLQPEYWACLVVVFLMIVLIPVGFTPDTPTAAQFLIHIVDLETAARLVSPEFPVGFWIDGALWLVPVIAGLYLVFPLVARAYSRHVWTGLLLAALISTCWKLAPEHLPGLFQAISGHETTDSNVRIIALDQTPAYFFSFALGMTAAWVYRLALANRGNPWIRRGVFLGFAVGIPAYVLVSIPFTHEALMTTTGFDGSSRGRGLALNSLASSTVRAVLLLALVLGPLWIQKPFANRPAKWMADLGFGIYLIHLPVAFYAGQLISPPRTGTLGALAIWTAIVLPTAIAYAWLSRRLVGLPVIRKAENWIKRRDSPAPTG